MIDPEGASGRYLRRTRVCLREDPNEGAAAYSCWLSSMSARWPPAAWDVVLAGGLRLSGLAQIHAPDPHRVIANPTFSAIVWTVAQPDARTAPTRSDRTAQI